jgi:uncharacterized membrane protein
MATPSSNPQSTAKISGHPIHPMLIPFPIAFFVATLACDIAYWTTANSRRAEATAWLLGAGIVMAALAAIAGLTDVLGDQRIRTLNAVWWHAGGNVLVVLLEIANWILRYTEGANAVVPTGFILSLIVTVILLFTGWKGWEMVYRHRVGVSEETPNSSTVRPHRAA